MAFGIRKVFFDCDGTLVESEVLAMKVAIDIIANAVENAQPNTVIDRAYYVQEYAGWHFDEMMKSFEQIHGVSFDRAALSADKTLQTLEALKAVGPVEHMQECLANLSANYGLALVTSSEFDRVNLCVTQAGMDSYFPPGHKYSAHDSLPAPKHKPAPDVYLLAKNNEGIASDSEAVAIEDSKSGVLSARAAGLLVVGFVAGAHIPLKDKPTTALNLIAHGASIALSDARDIPAALLCLDGGPSPDKWHGTVWLPETPVMQDVSQPLCG